MMDTKIDDQIFYLFFFNFQVTEGRELEEINKQ